MLKHNQPYLIVNADDLGLSQGVNQGIIEAHENGIVTSASLMTRYPAGRDAALYARAHPELSVGLHVDLGEWVYQDGKWVRRYCVVETDQPEAVETELMHQLQHFRELIGEDPTHLDSHQHAHRNEFIRSILLGLADELGIPLRECSESIRYDGRFFGQTSRGDAWHQGIGVDNLTALLSDLSPGITELGCHPGLDRTLDSAYRLERAFEVSTLCSKQIRTAIENAEIELISFRDKDIIDLCAKSSVRRSMQPDTL